MSAFPGPHATVYYNEAGEPLGWSDESGYEPDPDNDWEHDWEDIPICAGCGNEIEDEEDDHDEDCPIRSVTFQEDNVEGRHEPTGEDAHLDSYMESRLSGEL